MACSRIVWCLAQTTRTRKPAKRAAPQRARCRAPHPHPSQNFSAHQYRPLPALRRTHQATPHHAPTPTRTPPHGPQPAHANDAPDPARAHATLLAQETLTNLGPTTRDGHTAQRHKPVLPPPKRSSINPSPPPEPKRAARDPCTRHPDTSTRHPLPLHTPPDHLTTPQLLPHPIHHMTRRPSATSRPYPQPPRPRQARPHEPRAPISPSQPSYISTARTLAPIPPCARHPDCTLALTTPRPTQHATPHAAIQPMLRQPNLSSPLSHVPPYYSPTTGPPPRRTAPRPQDDSAIRTQDLTLTLNPLPTSNRPQPRCLTPA